MEKEAHYKHCHYAVSLFNAILWGGVFATEMMLKRTRSPGPVPMLHEPNKNYHDFCRTSRAAKPISLAGQQYLFCTAKGRCFLNVFTYTPDV